MAGNYDDGEFNHLHNLETLEEVYGFLDSTSQANMRVATETSHKLTETISLIPTELTVDWGVHGAATEQWIRMFRESGLKLKELKLIHMNGTAALSLELVSLLKENGVQSLRIESPQSFTHDVLSQLLGMTPNLRDISFQGLRTIEGQMQGNQQQQSANNPRLKSLKLVNSTCAIFPHIRSQLNKIWIGIDSFVQGVPEALGRFLEHQRELQSLGLDISREDHRLQLFNGHIDNNTFSFKLDSMVVMIFEEHPAASIVNLTRFIRSQHSTLQKLEIYHVNREVYRAIQDLHNLTTLTLHSMPSPINFRNGHVQELTVNLREFHTIENLKQLLRNHQNLRRLNTTYDFANRTLIEFISETLHELTHLSVKVLNDQLFRDIRFDNLQSLTVFTVAAGINWTRITNQITEFYCTEWLGTGDELRHMLRRFTGLTKLTVEQTEFKYDNYFLLQMDGDCPTLQEASLNISGFPDGFDLSTVVGALGITWLRVMTFQSFPI